MYFASIASLKLKTSYLINGLAAQIKAKCSTLLSAEVKTLSYMKWEFNHMLYNEYLFDAFFSPLFTETLPRLQNLCKLALRRRYIGTYPKLNVIALNGVSTTSQ